MKLTIKTENGQNIIDLKNDLKFDTSFGEQYIFSSGFSNYLLSFKDDQSSVVLTFNVDGKSIKIELNGIVPHLQANTTNDSNPTAIIINKDINNKDIDNLLTNTEFNGGEIIDRLEEIISKPVELGDTQGANVTLITDYQTLLESLGAAAAGGNAAADGNAVSNGSTFNSIFSLNSNSLADIAETDVWENLSESISTIPVETTDSPINLDIKVSSVTSDTQTEGTSLVHTVTLSGAADSVKTYAFTFTNGSVENEDMGIRTFSNGVTYNPTTGLISVPAGVTSFTITTPTVDDNIQESSETYTLSVGGVSASGTISDNEVAVKVSSVTSDTQTEGTSLVHTVTLSGAADSVKTYAFTFTNGSVENEDMGIRTFSNGVTYNPTTGLISVPAGVTSFTITTPTVDDNIQESSETYTLSVGGVSASGTISDNEVAVKVSSVTSDTQTEGTSLVHTVTLSGAADSVKTYAFTFTNGSVENEDMGIRTFSNGVTYNPTTGLISVPAGVTSFTITTPTVDDNIQESSETYTLSVGGVSASGTISDNEVAVKVSSVTSDTQTEGTSLVHTVTLSGAADSVKTYAFTFTNGSVENEDMGIRTFSNGVTYNSTTGLISVPAGVTSFTITTPTVDDNIQESSETYTLSVGGVSASGTISDNEVAVKVSSVTSDTQTEGTSLVHTVTLSGAADSVKTYAFTFTNGSVENEDMGIRTFSNGVTYNPTTGLISVPAGVTSFTITTPTVDDNIQESSETYTLSVGGVSASGTISDNEVAVKVSSVTSDTQTEGTSLVHTVTLSGAADSVKTYAFTFTNGSVENEDMGIRTFSNGVTYNPTTGLISVPAGVTSFTITTPTVDDNIQESSETYTLSVGGVSASGTISDNEVAVKVSSVTSDTQTEGTSLVHTVTLSGAADSVKTYAFTFTNGSVENEDMGIRTFSNGVTYNPTTGLISVPAGVTSFTITTPTVDDNIQESSETYTLSVGGVSASGTISDNEVAVKVSSVTSDTQTEGTSLVHTVTLSGAADSVKTYAFTFTNGSVENEDMGIRTFSNGVTYNPTTGLISVPAGVTSFTITTPTVDDNIQESSETYTLSVGGVSASGTISDNEVAVKVSSVTSDTQTEGTSLVHTVTLSGAADSVKTYAFTFTNGSVENEDMGIRTFSNGVTYNPTTGLISVPAGVTSFTITTPTVDDNIQESSETYTLSVGGVSASGTISDNEVAVKVSSVTSDTQTEGTSLVHTVTLSGAADSVKTYAFTFTNGSVENEDMGIRTFSNGVTYNPTTGLISVPAGVTSFTITTPTVDDNIQESSETYTLSVGGVSASGTISDNEVAVKVSSVTSDTQTEGTSLVHTVTLSGAADSVKTYAFTFTNGSVENEDMGIRTFSNGVTYNPTTGLISVPAGVTSFTITTPTVDDNIQESSETYTLSVGGVSASGTISDNEVAVKVSSVTSDTQTEGTSLVHTVTLSGAADSVKTYAFTFTNGSVENEDMGIRTFSNGVTYNPTTGLISVPAGVTSFTITTPTVDDNIQESSETYTLSVGGVSASGTISDNDLPLVANNNTATASETGNEFISSEDESNDGLKAIGNVIADDEGSNPLFITKIKFEGNTVTIPQDGSDITIQGDYGTLTINKSGLYTYLVNENTTDSWNTDRTEDDVFTYTLSDGYNPDDEATLTVTVEGKNDASVINSVTGNNQGYKVVDGLLDVNQDGIVDTIDPTILLSTDTGEYFSSNNGNISIDLGSGGTDMAVEYLGGQASYHSVLGFYEYDVNGNPTNPIILYIEDQSFVGKVSKYLGTLDNLEGKVGFFIVPNAEGTITATSNLTFDGNSLQLNGADLPNVYYTDNNLSTDGKDHAIIAKDVDGKGLVIAFEDLSLGDQDYDDFVIKIKPCVNTAVDTTTNFIVNGSFEDVTGIDSNGNYLTHADISAGGLIAMSTLTGWELLSDTARWMEVHDGAHAGVGTTDGENYLDLGETVSGTVSSNYNANAHIGQVINGAISGNTYELSFDYRDKAAMQEGGVSGENSGAVEVYWGGQLIKTIQANNINAWKTFSIEVIGGSGDGSNRLEFKEVGEGWDNWGIALDNITFYGTGTTSTDINIINNINISDVDDANLESATVVLTNYKAGDVLAANSLPSGITATIEEINGEIVVKLTGSATVVDYETAIASLTFDTTSENRIPRDFEITVNDGLKNSNTMVFSLNIGGCSLNTYVSNNTAPVAVDDCHIGDRIQGEFTVSEAIGTDGNMKLPDVTALSDGGYVIVWEELSGSPYAGNDSYGNWVTNLQNYDVFSQRYDSDGDLVGRPQLVNTFTEKSQHDSHVTALTDGKYLITWTANDAYASVDNGDYGSKYIRGQIFDANNNLVCSEFEVARAEYDPIIGLPDGGFIVTWSADARYNNTDLNEIDNPIYSDKNDGSSYGVFGQRYDSYGNKVGDSFQINTYTANNQIDSDITVDANGNLFVTWQSQNQDGSGYGIYVQKLVLTSNGVSKVGAEILVNTTKTGDQTDPEITTLTNGNIVITWESGVDSYARILNSNGQAVTNEIHVTTSDVTDGINPVITALDNGFLVVWQGNDNIYARTYNLNGNLVGTEKIVANTRAVESEPVVTTLTDGSYVIVWEDGGKISGHRYNADGTDYVQTTMDMTEDTSLVINVATLLANDYDAEDGLNVKFNAIASSTNGTAVLINNGTQILFTPNANYVGTAGFTYTVKDSEGLVSNAAKVCLEVKEAGEPTVFVGTLCNADIKGTNVIVNEGESAILAVRVSGADAGSSLSLALSNGTALVNSDYSNVFYYSFVNSNTDLNNVTWIKYTGSISVPEDASTLIVKTNTTEDCADESNEIYNLTATLSTGESALGTVTILDDDEDTITIDIEIGEVVATSNTTVDAFWGLGQATGFSTVTYSGSAATNQNGYDGTVNSSSGFWSGHGKISHNSLFQVENGEISFKFKDTNHLGDRTIFSKEGSFSTVNGIRIETIDELACDSNNNYSGFIKVTMTDANGVEHTIISSTKIWTEKWYDLSFKFGDDGMKLYIDGVLAGTNSYTGGLENNTNDITLAKDADLYYGSAYSGYIDNLSLKGGNGSNGYTYPLTVTYNVIDCDHSETVSNITLLNVPSDAVLSAGIKNADGSWTVTDAQLVGLSMTTQSPLSSTVDITAMISMKDSITHEVSVAVDSDDTLNTKTTDVVFEDDFEDGCLNGWSYVSLGGTSCSDTRDIRTINGDKELYMIDVDTAKGFMAQTISGISTLSSYILSVDVRTQPNNTSSMNDAIGLVFAYVNSNNYYKVIWNDFDVAYSTSTDYRDFSIVKVENGVETVLSKVDNIDITAAHGTDFNIKVDVSNEGIKAYIDNTLVTQTTTKPSTLGTFGLWTDDNDSGISYDNVKIETQSTTQTDSDISEIDLDDLIGQITNIGSVNLEDNQASLLKVNMADVVDLVDENHELVIKGDLADKVDLDTTNDWVNMGKEQLDGVNYKVYNGTGINSTIKLLIEDEIDII